jgi:type VI secretion system protein ImpA
VPAIDLERLLQKILPEAPSGSEDLEHDPDFMDLEKGMQGTPAIDVGGKLIQEAREPDWQRCANTAIGLLERTHDLRVAVSLTCALLHTDGFAGLRDGLTLICGFLEDHWDTVYPLLDPDDDNDPIERINALETLSDWNMVTAPLMKLELCSSRAAGKLSLRQYRIAAGKTSGLTLTVEEKNAAPNLATAEAVFAECDLEDLQAAAEAASVSLAQAKRLQSLIIEKAGAERAPDLNKLLQVIGEISSLLGEKLARRVPASPQARQTSEESPTPGKHGSQRDGQPAATDDSRSFEMVESREEVLELLEKICAYYELFEPASPVPYLLKRAMRLVDKNFLEILDDLAPGSLAQVEMICKPSKEGKP